MLTFLAIRGNFKKEIKIEETSSFEDLKEAIKNAFSIDFFVMQKYSDVWDMNIDLEEIPDNLTKIYIEEDTGAQAPRYTIYLSRSCSLIISYCLVFFLYSVVFYFIQPMTYQDNVLIDLYLSVMFIGTLPMTYKSLRFLGTLPMTCKSLRFLGTLPMICKSLRLRVALGIFFHKLQYQCCLAVVVLDLTWKPQIFLLKSHHY